MFRFRITCADCKDATFDVGCTGDCTGSCIECLRMPDGCTCCKDIGFQVCPTYETIENCACTDGTQKAAEVLTGCWVGFVISDTLAASLIAQATQMCPSNPHFILELYGSTYDFTSHTTTTDVFCPKSTIEWTTIEVSALVPDFQGAAITVGEGKCNGGAFFLSADDLGIITKPLPEGAGAGTSPCGQEGGCVALLMRIVDGCGNQLALCPFAGITGADYSCFVPPLYCENWNVTQNQLAGCELTYEFTHFAGDCNLVCTVTFGTDAPIVLDLADGAVQTFHKTIPGCPSGGGPPVVYTVRIQKTWDAVCIHTCSPYDSDTTDSFTV